MNIHKFFVTLLFLTGISVVLSAQDFPAVSNRLVNDYTQTLNTTEIDQLERKLVAFDDSTSIQIAVVIMKSTGRYDIADYGVRLAQKWGIGSKENDTGILLLVALGDRAVTIQTGYGVEGAVPDAIAYRIIENEIKPAFRQGNYYLGLQRATDALIAHTKGEYKADPKRRSEGGSAGSLVLLVLIIIVIIVLIAGRNNDGNSGEIMGRGGASDALWWSILLGGMGRGGRGGRGGFGGGGLGRGGGFGGGGFGGFGGGGFGGGGASGRW